MPRVSVNYDADQSALDMTGELGDRPEDISLPVSGTEEVVVAAQTMQQVEQAPTVQAYTVTHRAGDDVEREQAEARAREQREIEEKEKEREYQMRQQEYQREEAERQEREYQRQHQEDYERQIEQREYELRQYEENRRGYDNDAQYRDERKPYIPPGIK